MGELLPRSWDGHVCMPIVSVNSVGLGMYPSRSTSSGGVSTYWYPSSTRGVVMVLGLYYRYYQLGDVVIGYSRWREL